MAARSQLLRSKQRVVLRPLSLRGGVAFFFDVATRSSWRSSRRSGFVLLLLVAMLVVVMLGMLLPSLPSSRLRLVLLALGFARVVVFSGSVLNLMRY